MQNQFLGRDRYLGKEERKRMSVTTMHIHCIDFILHFSFHFIRTTNCAWRAKGKIPDALCRVDPSAGIKTSSLRMREFGSDHRDGEA